MPGAGPHSSPCPKRVDGYAPLGSYAALGDGQTVALVAADGSIDWWPLPTVDAPPGFAAILDARHGGRFQLAPAESAGEYTVRRRYLPDTNVLESHYTTRTGTVRVLEALSVGHGGRLPWTELVRSVEGVTGQVEMAWEIRPGDRFGTARPWTQERRGVVLLHVGDQRLALRAFDVGTPSVGPHAVTGNFSCEAGDRGLIALTSTDHAPIFLSDRDAIEARLELTTSRWREWSRTIHYTGRWQQAVRRSALALKLVQFAPTGAIAAAPTTSLPERLGGDKNWDYRYAWVRDTSFTADALLALQLQEEVQHGMGWLLAALRSTAPDLHVFYRLDGGVADGEQVLSAEGYRGSRPVRAGNAAAAQTQLGTYGDLFDTVWRYVEAGHLIDPETEQTLTGFADRCCDVWPTEDSGIWELPRKAHYTISKMGCWTALDRAVRLAESGEISTGHADRWARERDELRRWIHENCWSEERRSYVMAAGSSDLDAATLLAARTGFDRGDRLAGTIEAIREELCRGPLVYRYSGMDREEGCFLACTFWLVTALALIGDIEAATSLMDEAVDLTGDVGLLAEQMDPQDRSMLGNLPQGLSHLSLINAAVTLQAVAKDDRGNS